MFSKVSVSVSILAQSPCIVITVHFGRSRKVPDRTDRMLGSRSSEFFPFDGLPCSKPPSHADDNGT